jgi:hypothetical protein
VTAPWLSVLMPVYNGAVTIPATLASIENHGPGIEVIAVDQASRDGSRDLLRTWSGRLDLRIVDAPDSDSWMRNTNIALAEAKAPLVTMLHQDDLWRPGRGAALKAMAALWPEARLWLHAADYVDARGRKVGRFAPPFGPAPALLDGERALERLLVQNTVALPAAMFRRDDALALGGLDETLWYTADWDLWLRLAQLGPVAWRPDPLAAFRVHAGSLTIGGSSDTQGLRQQLAVPLERHLSALPPRTARQVGRLAALSNACNLCLAGAYHGRAAPYGRTLLGLIALGPLGWHRFLRDTNIIGRVAPRLRLKRAGD